VDLRLVLAVKMPVHSMTMSTSPQGSFGVALGGHLDRAAADVDGVAVDLTLPGSGHARCHSA
jgi:hypothetical protein